MRAGSNDSQGVYRLSAPARTPKATANDLSAGARLAWRHIRDAGGWWSACELGLAILPGLPPMQAAQKAGRWLDALARRLHVAERRRSPRLRRYGVTARCLPIHGETLEPADTPHSN